MLKTVGFQSTRTGDQTIVNGNIVIGTAGKGVDFSANAHAAGMTSELFDDYEIGTWTPDLLINGANTGITGTQTGRYSKVGRLVTVELSITLTNKGARTGGVRVAGLPYTSGIALAPATIVPTGTWASLIAGGCVQGYVSGSALYLLLGTATGTAALTDANLTNTSAFTAMATFSV